MTRVSCWTNDRIGRGRARSAALGYARTPPRQADDDFGGATGQERIAETAADALRDAIPADADDPG